MSLPIPLSVRLRTARTDLHVTRHLRDLSFRSVANGGYASAALSFDRPLSLQPDEVAYYGSVHIYDTRSGKTVWEGRLEDPGRSAGTDGQVWELRAVGPSAHASDRTVPLIYVDRNLAGFERSDNATPGGRDSRATDPGGGGGDNAIVLQWPQGLSIAANARVVVQYRPVWRAGQKLARVDYSWDVGVTAGANFVDAIARTDGSQASADVARGDAWNAAGGGSSPRVVVTNWTNGRNTIDLRILYTGGAITIADDLAWASLFNIVILAMRFNADGSEKTTGYSSNTVLASDVVADLLGRLLPQYDGANASIATTSFAIEQLAYPDGVTAARVLDDLLMFEPGYRWGAWESNSAGKHRFEFSQWPTVVRYEADAHDGYTSTGSAEGLYNAVSVRYRDINGQILSTRRTSTVPELTAAGLTREAQLDLGDEAGTPANANRAGDQFLAEHSAAPNAGRLTIARPIRDLITGHLLMPWEIVPGNLIRVRGIAPRVDALNATSRDGVTIFKIASHQYSAGNAAADLELDSYSPSTARALADLQRPIARRR